MVRCSVNPTSSVLLKTVLFKGMKSAQHEDCGTQRAGADGRTRGSLKSTLSNPTTATKAKGRAEGPVQSSSANAALLPSCSPGSCNLKGNSTTKHRTFINFYFCCFKRYLLFISAQIYLIISTKEKSSSRWGHSWGKFQC